PLAAHETAHPVLRPGGVVVRRITGGIGHGCVQKKVPSMGEDALAYSFLGMRPARNASRPASMAFFIADAISTGFCALAIAVFISTPWQPSSMAIAASDAVPTPASTMIGTLASSRIMRML